MRPRLAPFTLLLAALALCACASAWAAAPAAADVPGRFYETIDNPIPPANPARIEVQEFFWFGCPHCFRLDPLLSKWIPTLPDDVVFEHVPDSLGHPVGKLDQKAFYVAVALGVEHKIHTPLFNALHVQHLRLNTKAALRDFIVKTGGVTASQFDQAWDSFEVDSNVRRASQLAVHDGILSVPTLVIGGKYKIQAGLPGFRAMKGGELAEFHKMIEVANGLIAKVRKERGLPAP